MAKKILKKDRWAWIVSRIFDPVVLIPILLVASVFVALTNGLRWRFLVVLLLVDAVLPALYFIWGLRRGSLKDWDLSRREDRYGLYFFTAACHLFGLALAFFIGKILLFKILLIFWSLALVFALVTLVWKISVHGGVNGAIVAFFNHFFGWDKYWWLVVVLLIVLYSRVVIKKHSWSQVLAAAALAIAWVSLGLGLLGV